MAAEEMDADCAVDSKNVVISHINEEDQKLNMADLRCDFPEMLPKKKLGAVLRKFSVLKGNESDNVGKEEMVEMFNQFILPLPKRKLQLKRLRDARNPQEKQNRKSSSSFEAEKTQVLDKSLKVDVEVCRQKISSIEMAGSDTVRDVETEKLKNVVRISAGTSNKTTKPVKLKRKRSKLDKIDTEKGDARAEKDSRLDISKGDCTKNQLNSDGLMKDVLEVDSNGSSNNERKRQSEPKESLNSKSPKLS